MKKQRWRKTKKVRSWLCVACTKTVHGVPIQYKEEYCCNGYMCGCYGYPLNPVLCNKCEEKIHGKPVN